MVDTLGLTVGLVTHSAGIQDRDGASAFLNTILKRYPWLRHTFADGGYAGPRLKCGLEKVGKFTLVIVKRSDHVEGFKLFSRRWVVERTFSGDVAADWPKILRKPSRLLKHGCISQTFVYSPGASQEPDIVTFIVIQALKK